MPTVVLGLLLACIAWLGPVSGGAATSDETVKKIAGLSAVDRAAFLEEGARKEGQVVLYSSMSLSDYPKVIAAFEKRYPFVKTNVYRSTPSGVFTRLDTEARAGRYAADVVSSAPVEMWELKQKRLSTSYLSPERSAFPTGSYDLDGYWQGFEVTPLVLAFNTRAVASAGIPQTYQDLLSPRWKDKMSLGTDEYAWFSVMLDAMGKQAGGEYLRSLARQQLQMPGSSSVMRVQLMMAGESAIAIAARGRRVTEYKQQGAPIDFRILNPYPGEPNFTALAQRAPHPHAAVLFIDWILSEEGQVKMSELTGRISLRRGIRHQPRIQELFQKEFVFVSPSSIGPNLKEIVEQYSQIFATPKRR